MGDRVRLALLLGSAGVSACCFTPVSQSQVDAGNGPAACVAAGGTCVIGPPSNCTPGIILSAYDCNPPPVNPAGAICCAPFGTPAHCTIAGITQLANTPNPANPCEACQPWLSRTAWSPTSGSPCDGGACDQGTCRPGCAIDGAYFASGARDPATQGQCCAPTYSSTEWTKALQLAGTYPAGATTDLGHLNVQPLAVADFNGDGLDDIAVVTGDSSSVGIYLQRQNGTFAPMVAYDAGTPHDGVTGLAQGDIDGDGSPDLVVTNSLDSTLRVLFNDSSGAFSSQVVLDTGGSSSYGSVGMGDVNGDGLIDPVTLDSANGDAVIFLNLGHGNFSTARRVHTGPVYQSVTAASLRKDGFADLVTSGNSLNVVLNDQDGGFSSPISYPNDPVGQVFAFHSVGDFNGDGLPDIILTGVGDGGGVSIPPGEARIALGRGDGTFMPVIYFPVGTMGFPWGVPILEDLDNDGRPELLTLDDDLYIVWQDATGGLSAPVKYNVGADAGAFPMAVVPLGLGGGPRNSVAVLNWAGYEVKVFGNVCQ